jgi:hypothetical protein
VGLINVVRIAEALNVDAGELVSGLGTFARRSS